MLTSVLYPSVQATLERSYSCHQLLGTLRATLNLCLLFNLEVDPRCIALTPVTRAALAASSPSKASSTRAAQHHCFPTCPPHPFGLPTALLPQFPKKSSGNTKEPLSIASNTNCRLVGKAHSLSAPGLAYSDFPTSNFFLLQLHHTGPFSPCPWAFLVSCPICTESSSQLWPFKKKKTKKKRVIKVLVLNKYL